MKLDQLHCFQEACKYRSISVAAEKNYISQPSFSSAITKLEKELGVTLLNRTSRGVSPTPIGVVILEKVQGIFELVEDIQSVATAHSSYGTVQLATIPDLCDKILPISAQLAKAKNLNLQLTVHTAESDEIYHSVLSGVDSLGVVFFSTRVQSPELRFTPLFEDEYVLCVGPQSPYWDAESITIAEAMQQPYITYRDEFIKNNGGVSDVFKGMTPNIVLRTDDIESIKKLISHDNYVAFFPSPHEQRRHLPHLRRHPRHSHFRLRHQHADWLHREHQIQAFQRRPTHSSRSSKTACSPQPAGRILRGERSMTAASRQK